MVNDDATGSGTPDIDEEFGPDQEKPQGRFASWKRVDWIIAASRLIGLAVIVFGVANTINFATQPRGGIGNSIEWIQYASITAVSVSTGLLLIVAAEILDHLLSRDDR